LLKSLIRAAKRIYVQQVMLQQNIHELGKKTKTQKRKKEEVAGGSTTHLSSHGGPPVFLWIYIGSIISSSSSGFGEKCNHSTVI
jgi:hypothetical protein